MCSIKPKITPIQNAKIHSFPIFSPRIKLHNKAIGALMINALCKYRNQFGGKPFVLEGKWKIITDVTVYNQSNLSMTNQISEKLVYQGVIMADSTSMTFFMFFMNQKKKKCHLADYEENNHPQFPTYIMLLVCKLLTILRSIEFSFVGFCMCFFLVCTFCNVNLLWAPLTRDIQPLLP